MNLLLIDDDLIFLNQLHQRLNGEHHQTFKTNDSGCALKVLSENKIDLILAGASVPGAPLLSFICKLKGRHPSTPLILLSSAEHNHFVKSALLLGADVLVTRPLNFTQLFATISKYSA